MFLKKIFGLFGEKKVSAKHDATVVTFDRKKSSPMESNTDNSRLADGYDNAVHNTPDPADFSESSGDSDVELLSSDEGEIDSLAAIPNRDQMFDEGNRSIPAARAVFETSWTGAPEEGDVVEFEDEDSDEEDVVDELEKLTESDHAAADDEDFAKRHPMAAKPH